MQHAFFSTNIAGKKYQSGFIDYRLKYLRYREKKSKGEFPKPKAQIPIQESNNIIIDEVGLPDCQFNSINPVGENRTKILDYWRTSFTSRRNFIKHNNPCITDIVDKFKHVLSFDGEIVSLN